MNDLDASGPPPSRAAEEAGRLRVTVRHLNALYQQRHCERSEAIQSLSAVGFWIASAFAKASADKSLSLAMME
ncbi:hypothetical protein [Bradyrhizobium sp. NBAIM08]|nr:hypothetical protein [Bradyrhizobium sp. NBAIM08]MCA1474532.1 hypothetical protein [Bradyrhizobium sp. NBAIM08]